MERKIKMGPAGLLNSKLIIDGHEVATLTDVSIKDTKTVVLTVTLDRFDYQPWLREIRGHQPPPPSLETIKSAHSDEGAMRECLQWLMWADWNNSAYAALDWLDGDRDNPEGFDPMANPGLVTDMVIGFIASDSDDPLPDEYWDFFQGSRVHLNSQLHT